MRDTRELVFTRRPKPCAGDMRITWRLSLVLLALHSSRGSKASYAKLHVLNDALRSTEAQERLIEIIEGRMPPLSWQLRVEPAFTRALDFVVGEKFAIWSIANGRTSLKLTDAGRVAAKTVWEDSSVLHQEKEFLSAHARAITEAFVQRVLLAGKAFL